MQLKTVIFVSIILNFGQVISQTQKVQVEVRELAKSRSNLGTPPHHPTSEDGTEYVVKIRGLIPAKDKLEGQVQDTVNLQLRPDRDQIFSPAFKYYVANEEEGHVEVTVPKPAIRALEGSLYVDDET